jgi:hypothetical protein
MSSGRMEPRETSGRICRLLRLVRSRAVRALRLRMSRVWSCGKCAGNDYGVRGSTKAGEAWVWVMGYGVWGSLVAEGLEQ